MGEWDLSPISLACANGRVGMWVGGWVDGWVEKKSLPSDP